MHLGGSHSSIESIDRVICRVVFIKFVSPKLFLGDRPKIDRFKVEKSDLKILTWINLNRTESNSIDWLQVFWSVSDCEFAYRRTTDQKAKRFIELEDSFSDFSQPFCVSQIVPQKLCLTMSLWISYLLVCLLLVYRIDYSLGHGRLMEPAARNTLWRLNFASPPYFDDTELFCGGIKVSELFEPFESTIDDPVSCRQCR